MRGRRHGAAPRRKWDWEREHCPPVFRPPFFLFFGRTLRAAFPLFFLIFALGIIPRAGAYPVIQSLSESDVIFKQFASYRDDPSASLVLFEYRVAGPMTMDDIARSAQISLDALITVNRSSVKKIYRAGEALVVPTKSGVFVSASAQSDVEFLVSRRLLPSLSKQTPVIVRATLSKTAGTFYFLPEESLNTTEKNVWSIETFRAPVLRGTITSRFGYRISPISGRRLFHEGVDIAGKSSSEIFASLSGKVSKEGYSPVFGFYIVVEHENSYTTLYGHLLESKVKVGDTVNAGQFIAYMGSTGMSTGSHVHFEIRKNGAPLNPLGIMVIGTNPVQGPAK